MRNEEDTRWITRWSSTIVFDKGKEEAILSVDPDRLRRILADMNFLHMNDATRAMLRDMYPEVYEKLLRAQYAEAEKRLVTLING